MCGMLVMLNTLTVYTIYVYVARYVDPHIKTEQQNPAKSEYVGIVGASPYIYMYRNGSDKALNRSDKPHPCAHVHVDCR